VSVRALVFLGAAFVAGACTLGPDYRRPELPLPEGWRASEGPETASLADTPWWELFQDPELLRLIEIALRENQELRIAVERIEEARAFYGIARSELVPTVDLGVSSARVRASENGIPPLPAGVDNEGSLHGLSASAAWELDVFGRIRRASEAERARLDAAIEVRRAVAQALVAEVASTYVELRDLDRRLTIARDTLESRGAYVELARERFEGGLTSELDWRQAEAEERRTASRVHEFERLVRQRENLLSLLLGRGPGPIPRGATLEELPSPPSVPAGLPAALLERRPDLRAAEDELASASARIGEAKALLYPRIALTGAFGWESTELDTLVDAPSQSWSLAAGLLQPIFNGGRLRRGVEVAESRQRQALAAYEGAVLRALREVEDALVGLRQARLRNQDEDGRVAAERKVLELAELRYRGGVAAYLEVLDAQRSLFEAELDQAGARRDELLAVIELYRALGGGWTAEDGDPVPAVPPRE